MHRAIVITAITVASIGAALFAKRAASVESIDFPAMPYEEIQNIRDWVAKTDREISFEAMDGRWYVATFATPCVGLAAADMVDIDTSWEGRVNRNASIIVNGNRCVFSTFKEAQDPRPPVSGE